MEGKQFFKQLVPDLERYLVKKIKLLFFTENPENYGPRWPVSALILIWIRSLSLISRELKTRRRQRQRKRHRKREFPLLQASSLLFQLFHFVKFCRFSQEMTSKRTVKVYKKKKKIVALVFTSAIKREIRKFHVVIVQWLEMAAK